nr:hypothetical protein CTI12_AA123990 [Tanacetum cinerariifolium]
MSAFLNKETGEGVDETIVVGLIAMLDETSTVTKAFRMTSNLCHSHESINFELYLLSDRPYVRQYNTPTVSEIAALITNNFRDGVPSRDIVMDINDGGTRKTKYGFVSMKEYYTYIIQQRNGQDNTLLRGGRSYQQYLVDAYTDVEEQRLKWTRNN